MDMTSVTSEQKRQKLRQSLVAPEPLVAVGAHDAMSAQLIEQHGFDAVWVSGFGISTMAYAVPDLNLVTQTETLEGSVRIDRAVTVPVIADCDNGFGALGNVVGRGSCSRPPASPVCASRTTPSRSATACSREMRCASSFPWRSRLAASPPRRCRRSRARSWSLPASKL